MSAPRHAIGVANGTDAITIALRAIGRRPGRRGGGAVLHLLRDGGGDPPHRRRAGVLRRRSRDASASPPQTVRAALTPRTKAVIAVHLFGNVAPVREIEALGVPVLEDAAQAAGSPGSDGARRARSPTAATFSFYPSKNLGAFGDGGAITTNDAAIAERVRSLHFHGSPRQAATSRWSATTRALTRSRRPSCACSCPHLGRLGEGSPRRRRALRAVRAGRARRRCRARAPARRRPGTCSSCAASHAPTRSSARPARRRASRPARTTACRSIASPPLARGRRACR